MKKENKFDKNKYDQKYIKDNYKRVVMNLRPHIVNYIDSGAKKNNLNRTAFMTACINYCIHNNIDLSEYVINTDK